MGSPSEVGEARAPRPWLYLPHDGASVRVAIVGDPHARDVVFAGGRYVPVTSAHRAQRPTLRISFNMVVLDSMQLRVLEHTRQMFEEIRRLRSRFDLDAWSFTVTRRDVPHRRYSVERAARLTPVEIAQIQAMRPYDLAALFAAPPSPERLMTYDLFLAARSSASLEVDPFA